jgi:hypothetical protein
MSINDLGALVTVLLSISLAAERLVAIIQTLFPWLALEKKNEAQGTDLKQDRWRHFTLQVIMFLSAWTTSGFLSDGGFNLLGFFKFASISGAPSIPIFVLGVLSSGGSAFWSSILGYTKAVKDIRTAQNERERLEYQHRVKEFNLAR